MNSCRAGVHIWPTLVMNSMPLIHSAGVRFTSRAKACRWRTALSMISFMRGSGVVDIWATTTSVIDSGVYGCMAFSLGRRLYVRRELGLDLPAIVRVGLAIFNSEVKIPAYGRLVFC